MKCNFLEQATLYCQLILVREEMELMSDINKSYKKMCVTVKMKQHYHYHVRSTIHQVNNLDTNALSRFVCRRDYKTYNVFTFEITMYVCINPGILYKRDLQPRTFTPNFNVVDAF
ncbi:hypothetical protein ACF0H5_008043 [Mactra antiquata]